jgi:hypothetical protein
VLSRNRLDLVSLADPLWNVVELDDDEAADVIVLDDEAMTEAAEAMELTSDSGDDAARSLGRSSRRARKSCSTRSSPFG